MTEETFKRAIEINHKIKDLEDKINALQHQLSKLQDCQKDIDAKAANVYIEFKEFKYHYAYIVKEPLLKALENILNNTIKEFTTQLENLYLELKNI